MLDLFAYLDPGSGSLLVQIILGGFGALLVGLRLFWRYIKSPFVRSSDSESESTNGGAGF